MFDHHPLILSKLGMLDDEDIGYDSYVGVICISKCSC